MSDLLSSSDGDFERAWFSMSDEERSALPSDIKSQGFDRINRLHSYVGDSIERLRREQEREDRPKATVTALDPHAPSIMGADDYYEAVDALWAAGLPKGAKTGWPSVDAHYTVAAGQMTILTGWPGSGKSEWLDHLMVNLSRQSWKFAVFSAENLPVEFHIAKLLEKRVGKPFGDGPNPRIPREELAEHCMELTNNFRFICQKERAVNLEDIIKASGQWLLNDDGRQPGLIIDPWNEVEHARPRHVSETEYISSSLSYVRNWARQNGVHIWIVAHPAKQPRNDGKLPIPTPDMISGSQHWWNKADAAITVYRDPSDLDSRETSIFVQKIRFKNIGIPGEIKLRYDRVTGRYSETRNLYQEREEQ